MNEVFKSILAGVCIGIAGTVYLRVGGVAGAVMFSFGLVAVVSQDLWLFTGKAYACWDSRRHPQLWVMLALNWTGCMLVAVAAGSPGMTEAAESIMASRLTPSPFYGYLLRAALCGFIMTAAVRGVAKGNWLPLLLGVPAFILGGFCHCVADAFYIFSCSWGFVREWWAYLGAYMLNVVVGNLVGCNIIRLAELFERKNQET